MGLMVGDVIQGRKETEYREGGFHDVRLEILWLGADIAVFRAQRRSDMGLEWSDPHEETAWTLDCRRWWKVTPNAKVSGSGGSAADAGTAVESPPQRGCQ